MSIGSVQERYNCNTVAKPGESGVIGEHISRTHRLFAKKYCMNSDAD